jgi:hypothetical protein
MTGALTMRTFQCIWALVSAYFAHRCVASAKAAFSSQAAPTFVAARLVPLALRNQSLSPASAVVADFGLLRGGCPIAATNVLVQHRPDGSVVLSLPEPVPFVDGYFFDRGVVQPGRDPVRWRVDISDNRVAWAVWAVQVWRIDSAGVLRLYPDIDAVPAGPPGSRVLVELQIKWTWVFNWVLPNACLAAGGFAMAAAGACNAEWLVHPAAVTATSAAAGSWMAAAIGFWLDGEARKAAAVLVLLPPTLLMVACAVHETRVISFLFLFSLTSFAGYWIRDCWIYPSPLFPALCAALVTPAAISLAFAVTMTYSRYAARHAAQQLMLQDWGRYNKLWNAVVRDPASRAAAEALAIIVTNLCFPKAPSSPARRGSLPPDPEKAAESECRFTGQFYNCQPWAASSAGDLLWPLTNMHSGPFRPLSDARLGSVARQCNRLRISGTLATVASTRSAGFASRIHGEVGLGDCGVEGWVDPLAPVDSLDQLYAQACSPQTHSLLN